MMHVFGPVRSRRLGRSLGVDPIPFKTCNWNCVYCQLGRSLPLVTERAEYFSPEAIVSEIEQALASPTGNRIDWITVGGAGEPTLHASLGWILRRVKAITEIPVAVLTNGSLLDRPEVRADLNVANAVLPTLNAGSEAVHRALARPAPGLTLARLVEGLVALRAGYRGQLWVEVMLVRGVNDSHEALADIATALAQVRPDEVHVNLPQRPPAEPWVMPPDARTLRFARRRLGAITRIATTSASPLEASSSEALVDQIAAVVTRHPLRDDELRAGLPGRSAAEVARALEDLESDGRARIVRRHGHQFWTSAAGRYGAAGPAAPEKPERRST